LHGLINANDFLEKCKQIDTGALLCGHVHETYRVSLEGLKSDLFCAGSATMEGHEGFWMHEVEEKVLKSKCVYWNGTEYHFRDT